MKKSFKTMTIAAFAAMFALAGCSKNDGGPEDNPNEIRSVRIKISNGTDGGRAVGDHVGNDQVVFKSGYLFFTNTAGTITKMVTIDGSNNAEVSGVVGSGALTANNGTMIENVPGTSVKVYVVGNLATSLPTITIGTTNISAVHKLAVPVSDLFDATDKGVADVPIYGAPGNIVADGVNYKASLTIAPVGARMEVGKLTAGGSITAFKVEGIYVNNYYSQMELGSAIINAATDLKFNGSDPAKYVPAAAGSIYTTALSGIVYDYLAGGIGNYLAGNICAPTDPENAAKVWGYNLLAPASGEMPHVIVRLSGVTTSLDNDPYANKTWFLTIKNFYSDPGMNTTPITTLAARNVYRIKNLTFTENDLAPEPEVTTKKVTVEVSVLTWVSNDIGYDFD